VTHPWLEVAAGAILSNARDEVLLALRKADQHQGNLWEFPGGKLEPNEAPSDALARELSEEIGIKVSSLNELTLVEHQYSDKSVRLHVFVVEAYSGEPVGLEGQTLRWVPMSELSSYDFPAANLPILEALLDFVGAG